MPDYNFYKFTKHESLPKDTEYCFLQLENSDIAVAVASKRTRTTNGAFTTKETSSEYSQDCFKDFITKINIPTVKFSSRAGGAITTDLFTPNQEWNYLYITGFTALLKQNLLKQVDNEPQNFIRASTLTSAQQANLKKLTQKLSHTQDNSPNSFSNTLEQFNQLLPTTTPLQKVSSPASSDPYIEKASYVKPLSSPKPSKRQKLTNEAADTHRDLSATSSEDQSFATQIPTVSHPNTPNASDSLSRISIFNLTH